MPYNVHAVIGKKKGKFVKLKVKRAIEAIKYNLHQDPGNQHENCLKQQNLEGRRVVELSTLGEQLWCHCCDKALSLRDVIGEQQCGFASVLKVTCASCGQVIIANTNKQNAQKRCYDVNLKAAIATIDAGIGESQMNTICSSMNIPSISAKLLKRYERIVGPVIEAVAKGSCEDSVKLEKKLSIERDRTDNNRSNNSPPTNPNSPDPTSNTSQQNSPACSFKTNLIASFDAGWQKRGTGHAYNSLSGHSSLIGYYTGKVLSYCTRSKKCRQCEAGQKKEDHQCRKNFSGSAKAMEPDMAVEVVNENELLKNKDAKISVLIGDEDSCTIAAVRRESGEHIEKWSDFNHALKAFKNSLWSMKLQPKLITYFSNCFSCAIKQNKGNPTNAAASLKNVVPHAFGDHRSCGEWCNHKFMGDGCVHANLPHGKPLSDETLRDSMSKLFDRFAANAVKLAPCASSQPNESFNNVVASKHPKSKFYGGSQSFDVRVAAAVGQKNIGTKYIVNINEAARPSPGKETQKYRESKDKKREAQANCRRSVEFKKKRLFAKKTRSAKTAATSNREGIMYQTESGFNNVLDLLHYSSTSENVDFGDCSIVIFDLETTGLHKSSEICQIAACTERGLFNCHIIPSRRITPGAAQVTGLRVSNGEMFLRDSRLDTVPARTAFTDFLSFLQSQGQSLILAAHNAFRFDAPRILQLAADLGSMNEFLSTVKGFADTLHVFREKLPERKLSKQKFTQEALATDFIDPSDIQEAHNAINDVQILQKLMSKVGVEKSLLAKHTRSVQSILKSDEAAKKTAFNRASLDKFTGISDHMKNKISKAGIDNVLLEKAFAAGYDEGVRILLAEDIGGKPRITKSKKIIDRIVQQLRNT